MLSQLASPGLIAAAALLLGYLNVAGEEPGQKNLRAFAAQAAPLLPQLQSHPLPQTTRHVIKIAKSPDGLFYVTANVNGVQVLFLVDTGANLVVLTPQDAERAGVSNQIALETGSIDTAGGASTIEHVKLSRVNINSLDAADIDAAVAHSGLKVSLLGQNMLSKMRAVTINGDEMSLQTGS
ncbi:retropepsin-like aspartic protease family protein [Novosphingobium sp.]|uniref:retropepsin-like aspartic protease family protein n=1 Tax=Novosphingobium sp. TaxID=1874826 RepID=UPI003B518D46